MIVDLFLVYSFIKRLVTPFNEWPAYKLGIIDENGNILRKRNDLRTIKERDAFGIFDVMILKLKKLLEQVPGGRSRIASYAAALWLIKESKDIEELGEYMTEEHILNRLNHYIHYTKESVDVNQKFEKLFTEDGAPVNSAGSGNIAGIGVGPDGEPGVSRPVQRRIQKKQSSVLRRFKTFDDLNSKDS